jgi:hypothetical protein
MQEDTDINYLIFSMKVIVTYYKNMDTGGM